MSKGINASEDVALSSAKMRGNGGEEKCLYFLNALKHSLSISAASMSEVLSPRSLRKISDLLIKQLPTFMRISSDSESGKASHGRCSAIWAREV